ncbi:MAG: hypothetical protein K9J37_12820 [Saprospiraceae bacterium]|nr:hypothetical protein [Saprospiraceae bacterium]MCF8250790.1 hypothetical protein [Saprospiraceae bacterium]MCF8281768.1 hypothetical protein [Bacteroidales bacterium]MCF8312591.1 hypothetical protein [Saprospiraceae bacterium]MCF8440920.1 hypothetical protein [Saprospiraceae bacterium]
MNFDTFKSSPTPPFGNPLLAALWHDAHGDWEAAHNIAQEIHTRDGAWIHAYLHRKEGDAFNASYWYRQAGRPVFTGSLEAEWEVLVRAFL